MTKDELLTRLFAAARAHGDETGSEAEIGDLEILFVAAFRLLTPDQVTAFLASAAVASLRQLIEYEGLLAE